MHLWKMNKEQILWTPNSGQGETALPIHSTERLLRAQDLTYNLAAERQEERKIQGASPANSHKAHSCFQTVFLFLTKIERGYIFPVKNEMCILDTWENIEEI